MGEASMMSDEEMAEKAEMDLHTTEKMIANPVRRLSRLSKTVEFIFLMP